jgi:hypothetical protein
MMGTISDMKTHIQNQELIIQKKEQKISEQEKIKEND